MGNVDQFLEKRYRPFYCPVTVYELSLAVVKLMFKIVKRVLYSSALAEWIYVLVYDAPNVGNAVLSQHSIPRIVRLHRFKSFG